MKGQFIPGINILKIRAPLNLQMVLHNNNGPVSFPAALQTGPK